MNGSMWLSYRFMTKGFEEVPFYGEPYNKPYYPSLFEKAGFTPLKHWHSTISQGDHLRQMVEKCQPRYASARETGYRFRPLNLARYEDELRLLHRLISQSFSGFLGFHPLDEQTFISLYRGLRSLAIPELIQFALDPAGEVVGYVCTLPDHPHALRAMGGESHLWAKLNFLMRKGSPKTHVTLYLGITPEEAARRTGTGGALAYLATKAASEAGVPLIGALMAEDSYAKAYSSGRHSQVRAYALYQRAL